MARIRTSAPGTGHTLLIVDDDDALRGGIARLLRAEGHEVLEAPDGAAAVTLCRERDVHLMLLDYFMPGLNGAQVVEQVRTFDDRMQIVLQTGYASERPPRQMLAELDIQGYHDKSEGPERLLVWADAALKTYRHVRALSSSREGLEFILRATPELHSLQPLEDLLRGVLLQIQGLLGFQGACLATLHPDAAASRPPGLSQPSSGLPGPGLPGPGLSSSGLPGPGLRGDVFMTGGAAPHGLVALNTAAVEGGPVLPERRSAGRASALPGSAPFALRVGTGRFAPCDWAQLSPRDQTLLEDAAESGVAVFADRTVLPLKVGRRVVGVVLFDSPLLPCADVHLLEIFASQAAVAIENARLYALATIDDLTGLMRRRPWQDRLERTLQMEQTPSCVLVFDIDHFKRVNDTHGHLAGDRVLETIGAVVRATLRSSDVAGRYGGEELVALLPGTALTEAVLVAERLREAVAAWRVPWEGTELRVTVSVGVAEALPGVDGELPELGVSLIARADQALYAAKHAGRDRVVAAPGVASAILALA